LLSNEFFFYPKASYITLKDPYVVSGRPLCDRRGMEGGKGMTRRSGGREEG